MTQSLIQRLESAPYGHDGLCQDVLKALGWHYDSTTLNAWIAPDGIRHASFPRVTQSMDAARLTVPKSHSFALGDCGEDDHPWACVTRNDGDFPDFAASAATPELALCAAILKARTEAR